MADVATLGIEVRSDQVRKGTADLDKLSGAASRAEAATKGLATGARGASAAAAAVSSSANAAVGSLNREAAAANQAAKALDMHARAANQNVRGLQKANVGNIAAQLQDVAVSAQMGMGALQIGLQQGTQLASVIAAMDNPIRGLGDALLSVISPVSLLTIGLIALIAAGLQMVDWPKLAASALNAFAGVLETIAPYATIAAAGLALLYGPAIVMGIVQVIALLGRMAVAAVAAAAAMAVANPGVAFVLGITAAVAAANVFRDELTQIFGRDIVGDAKAAVNFVIGAFVGGFQAIKATWSALPSAIGDLVYQAANFTVHGVESMINKVIDMLNDFVGNAYNSLSGLAGKIGVDLGTFKGIGKVELGGVGNPYSGAASSASQAAGKAMSGAMETDYVGGFGEAISRGASAATGKLKELADWVGKVDEKTGKKARGGKSEEEKYSDIVDGANRRIASLQAERDALGLTEVAAAKLAYETDLLNEAQQKGIALTAAQKVELSSLAGRMAEIEVATAKAREAMEFNKDLTRGFIDDFRSGIEQGKTIWESFANAALNALDKIVDKVLNDLMDALFQVSQTGSGGSGGGILGFLGSLFSGFGGGINYSMPGLYAEGGYTGAGTKYEPAGTVHRGEYVFSAAATKALGVLNLDRMHRRAKTGYAEGGYVGGSTPMTSANSNSRPAANGNMHITIGWSRTADGNLTPFIESIAEQKAADAAGQAVAKNNVRMPDMVQSINRDPRKRVGGLK